MSETLDELKVRFNRAFPNVPIPERSNAIYVSQKHGAMSWHVVRLEIEHDTLLGLEAVRFMAETGII